MKFNEKLEHIKVLTDNEYEDFNIEYSLLRTEEMIKNYTNVSKLPDSVDFTHIEMSLLHLSFMSELYPSKNDEDGTTGNALYGSSIKEGDTNVEFGKASDLETTMDKLKAKRVFEDSLLEEFKPQLHHIRRMRW